MFILATFWALFSFITSFLSREIKIRDLFDQLHTQSQAHESGGLTILIIAKYAFVLLRSKWLATLTFVLITSDQYYIEISWPVLRMTHCFSVRWLHSWKSPKRRQRTSCHFSEIRLFQFRQLPVFLWKAFVFLLFQFLPTSHQYTHQHTSHQIWEGQNHHSISTIILSDSHSLSYTSLKIQNMILYRYSFLLGIETVDQWVWGDLFTNVQFNFTSFVFPGIF